MQIKPAKQKLETEIFEWLEALAGAVIFMILVLVFFFRIATVNGDSMLPTLIGGDRLFISRLFYEPQYGDIVAVSKPNRHNQVLIKRIIATEGQEIDIDFDKGEVYVDGVLLEEPYINEPTVVNGGMAFPAIVPEGSVFAMGDNRNESLDSRFTEVGMVDEGYIMGRNLFRIMPFGRIGKVE